MQNKHFKHVIMPIHELTHTDIESHLAPFMCLRKWSSKVFYLSLVYEKMKNIIECSFILLSGSFLHLSLLYSSEEDRKERKREEKHYCAHKNATKT